MKRIILVVALAFAAAAVAASGALGSSRGRMAPLLVPAVCNPCLYYSGDFNPSSPDANALYNAINDDFPITARVYTPVTPDHDWLVTGLFANELIFPADVVPSSISWEIRTGMSVGNGGSVYASGPASPMSWTATGRTAFGETEYSGLAQLATPVVLHQGVTYWINVLPEVGGGVFAAGPYESNIDGGGANHFGPANVLNDSFFNSADFGANYAAATDYGSFSGFSFGVLGTLALDCSTATATPNVLWPPNHKLRTITLGGVTDPNGGPVTFTVNGVTQDEPLLGQDSGNTTPDAVPGKAPNTVQLRAERSGLGNGRVYRIAFTATAGSASCTGVVTVGVPLNQSGAAAVDSAPPSYNSFGP